MDTAEYQRSICNRLRGAETVPFVRCCIGTWEPRVAHCHENVDHWVGSNPGHTPLRGWVTCGDSGAAVLLTPHSVVRGRDGRSFDITPLENEKIRHSMRFVPHIGSEAEFFRYKDLFQPFLTCENPNA
jgi:hypothetical protein